MKRKVSKIGSKPDNVDMAFWALNLVAITMAIGVMLWAIISES